MASMNIKKLGNIFVWCRSNSVFLRRLLVCVSIKFWPVPFTNLLRYRVRCQPLGSTQPPSCPTSPKEFHAVSHIWYLQQVFDRNHISLVCEVLFAEWYFSSTMSDCFSSKSFSDAVIVGSVCEAYGATIGRNWSNDSQHLLWATWHVPDGADISGTRVVFAICTTDMKGTDNLLSIWISRFELWGISFVFCFVGCGCCGGLLL